MNEKDRKRFSKVQRIWKLIQQLQAERGCEPLGLLENTFYVYRTDNNQVLARGLTSFEAAKTKANQLRRSLGLSWDQVRFRMDRTQYRGDSSGGTFGVSRDGRYFTDGSGIRNRVDYSGSVNPSKGRRFRGFYDKDGNYYDID